jgi:hypothetical protein
MAAANYELTSEVVAIVGESMSIEALPRQGTTRWVARRKAEVVAAIEHGLISVRDACDRYELSLEELVTWQRAVERDGISGLRATKAQELRLKYERNGRRVLA